MTPPIQLVTLADQNFVLPLAVLVRSVLDHLGADRALHVIVIDGGIDRESRARLESSWTDQRLTVSWCPPGYGSARALPTTGRIPALTYARLQAPHLPIVDGDRLIVLDADQLVLTDLGLLADLPFRGSVVLAPRDAFIPTVGARNGLADHERLGLRVDAPYFAGALMVIDTEKWRCEEVSRRTLEFVTQNAARLHAYDQDALNAVLAGQWTELDPRFQVQPRALHLRASVTPHLSSEMRTLMVEDPWIAHFSGRLKPWLYHGRSRFDHLFRETLSRTAFRDHRPPRTAQSVFFGLYDGGLRRFAYPLEVRLDGALREMRRRREAVS